MNDDRSTWKSAAEAQYEAMLRNPSFKHRQWYYVDAAGMERGPVPEPELIRRIRLGDLGQQVKVRTDLMKAVKQADSIPYLVERIAASPSPSVELETQGPPTETKVGIAERIRRLVVDGWRGNEPLAYVFWFGFMLYFGLLLLGSPFYGTTSLDRLALWLLTGVQVWWAVSVWRCAPNVEPKAPFFYAARAWSLFLAYSIFVSIPELT